jgi:hypothetical protein
MQQYYQDLGAEAATLRTRSTELKNELATFRASPLPQPAPVPTRDATQVNPPAPTPVLTPA